MDANESITKIHSVTTFIQKSYYYYSHSNLCLFYFFSFYFALTTANRTKLINIALKVLRDCFFFIYLFFLTNNEVSKPKEKKNGRRKN